MFNVCPRCGCYSEEKTIQVCSGVVAVAVCPNCGHAHPFRRQPLFLVTGASGAGKTAVCTQLSVAQVQGEPWVPDCIYLEQDILWRDEFVNPEDGYSAFRNTWLRVAKNVGQAGRPVVLCGSAVPAQYDACPERRYFAALHYLALVCDADRLRERLLARPAWRRSGDDAFLERMVAFNGWLRDRGAKAESRVMLLDTTLQSERESARQVAAWIQSGLHAD